MRTHNMRFVESWRNYPRIITKYTVYTSLRTALHFLFYNYTCIIASLVHSDDLISDKAHCYVFPMI